MYSNLRISAFLALSLILSISACSSGSPSDSPAEVADQFWTAAQNRDMDAVLAVSLPSDSASMNFESEQSSVEGFELGETIIEGASATVAIEVDALLGSEPKAIAFETILVQQDGAWLVDVDKTSGSMIQAVMGVSMEALGEAMAEGMREATEGMMEAMTDVMVDGMQQMGEAMGDAMEEGVGDAQTSQN